MNDELKDNDTARETGSGNETAKKARDGNDSAVATSNSNDNAREMDKSKKSSWSKEGIATVSCLVAIIGILISLFVFIVSQNNQLRAEMTKQNEATRTELKADMNAGFTRIENRLNSIDGRIDGLYRRAEVRDKEWLCITQGGRFPKLVLGFLGLEGLLAGYLHSALCCC